MTTPERVRELFEAQRRAREPGDADYRSRMEWLARLRQAVVAREAELVAALDADFGGRAAEETRALELFPLLDQIRHARRHLKGWMGRHRVGSSWFLFPSRAYYRYEPLGVVGVIGAWNYQVLLSLGPLVDALAAGNRVMIKPSELAPRSAEVIAALVGEAFPPERVACATGGPEVGRTLSELPFDHLLFTGSARVGRQVLRAAAKNLTPVTLELGGKSPAIVHASYPVERAARRILAGKLLNAGQTCLAPDYVLLPAGREAAFEAAARRAVSELYPDLPGTRDYTRIVDREHLERLRELVEEARAGGARVVPLAGQRPVEGRAVTGDLLLTPTLVFEPPAASTLMTEEIFGPVLPVIAYDDIESAIEFVTARPRPLALYCFDRDAGRADALLRRLPSGGATVNGTLLHFGQHRLPFGGVGESGMGRYHGMDGFATFSHKRGVMVQSRWAPIALVRAPYEGLTRRLVDLVMKVVSR